MLQTGGQESLKQIATRFRTLTASLRGKYCVYRSSRRLESLGGGIRASCSAAEHNLHHGRDKGNCQISHAVLEHGFISISNLKQNYGCGPISQASRPQNQA